MFVAVYFGLNQRNNRENLFLTLYYFTKSYFKVSKQNKKHQFLTKTTIKNWLAAAAVCCCVRGGNELTEKQKIR